MRCRLFQIDRAGLAGLACLLLGSFTFALAAEPAGPERWEKEIQRFAEQDRHEAPPPDAILFVGSSSIRLWDTASSFPEWPTINRGFGGSQISDVNYYFDSIVRPHTPRVIVFYAGDNDIAAGESPHEVAKDFQVFLRRVRETVPHTHVVYLGIKPSIARWEMWDRMQDANHRIERLLSEDPRGHYVDTATPLLGSDGRPEARWFVDDGLHLSPAGYARWTEALTKQLEALKPAG